MCDKIHDSNSSSSESAENPSCEVFALPEENFFESEVQILSPEDIAYGALARLFDDYSDFLVTTMSEEAAMIHKRAIFNEDNDIASGLVYPKSRIPRSPRIVKPTIHFPSSSGQGSPKIRHISPTNRHLSPHRSISKNKIVLYNWGDDNSIRKTQSTALAALKNGPWPRSTTVSTPDLKVEVQSVGTEVTESGSYDRRRYTPITCRNNLRIIYVILNCIILAAALLYLVAGIFLNIYRKTALIIIENPVYALCVLLFYIEALILMILSLVQLCCIQRGSRKKQISCSLVIAAFTISLAVLQNTLQTHIQTNMKEQMISSIRLEPEVNSKAFWNFFHETFKCCGVHGHLDWCKKNIRTASNTISEDSLGSYTCHLPISCCIPNIDEIIISEGIKNPREDTIPCTVFPTPWNTYKNGCLTHVRREIYYLGKLFKIISFGTGILLLLTAATATISIVYL